MELTSHCGHSGEVIAARRCDDSQLRAAMTSPEMLRNTSAKIVTPKDEEKILFARSQTYEISEIYGKDFDYAAQSDNGIQCDILNSILVSPFIYSIPSSDGEFENISGEKLCFADADLDSVFTRKAYACEPAVSVGKTLPILPGIKRNHYGGVLNCVPPLQITKFSKGEDCNS